MRAEGNPASMPMMIKPRTLGVLAKAERRKVGASYIVTALGLFDLARPDADRFETDQALWLLAAKALPKGSVIDVGMPKPRAELLIGGAARAPTGQPATAMAVEWAVGPLRKRLVAFGDRYWQIADGGVAATSPRPFTEIPLSPERAFGGAGFADNPGGSATGPLSGSGRANWWRSPISRTRTSLFSPLRAARRRRFAARWIWPARNAGATPEPMTATG